jgi:hypothetical protein
VKVVLEHGYSLICITFSGAQEFVFSQKCLKTKGVSSSHRCHPRRPNGAQPGPLGSKMVSKMALKPYPGHLRTRSNKKHTFFMICCPAGILKIIESVELSSISRFSHYTRTTSKCHSPGSVLGHFSGPLGIEKVSCTCYKTFPKSCLSQSGSGPPRPPEASKVVPKWGTQKHVF